LPPQAWASPKEEAFRPTPALPPGSSLWHA
jgi:hypothetical protein